MGLEKGSAQSPNTTLIVWHRLRNRTKRTERSFTFSFWHSVYVLNNLLTNIKHSHDNRSGDYLLSQYG